MTQSAEGPRIYNLFPLLVGSIDHWHEHIERIAEMGFNWIFVNPFHYPGFSGSLYAVKDYYRLHPLFHGDDHSSMEELLRGFVDQAEKRGLRVMLDLVLNHTARDSDLVDEHPDWYVLDEEGEVVSPFAVHPDDEEDITVWGDLAELDYSPRPERREMIDYFKKVIDYYSRLGFHGFRCDAAYKVPGEVWGELIEAARRLDPHAVFFAETLGAGLDQVKQLKPAGFDYFFNSARWWDFKEEWLLEQYEKFRKVAPSIAFPESHDTERLAGESDGDERDSKFRYLFTAFFSAGVMMPIGYEFGFGRRLHVVESRPEDWEKPSFDISGYIAEVNGMKAETPVLNEEGPQHRFTGRHDGVVGLLRHSTGRSERVAALINPRRKKEGSFPVEELASTMKSPLGRIREITPGKRDTPPAETGVIHLEPRSIRIFLTDAPFSPTIAGG